MKKLLIVLFTVIGLACENKPDRYNDPTAEDQDREKEYNDKRLSPDTAAIDTSRNDDYKK